MKNFVITEYHNSVMGFLLEDTTLIEAHSFDVNSILGNVYVATVMNVIDNLGAAFVSIGNDINAYYDLKENNDRHIFLNPKKNSTVKIGDILLVQISKEAIKTKKPEATANISLQGKYLVANRSGNIGVSAKIKDNELRNNLKANVKEAAMSCIDSSLGAVIRTAAGDADIELVFSEAKALFTRLGEIIKKARFLKPHSLVYSGGRGEAEYVKNSIIPKYPDISIRTDIKDVYDELLSIGYENTEFFSDEMTTLNNVFMIDKQINRALARKVFLKSGGYLVVDVTEAFTIIDVNTGKAITGNDKEKHSLKLNMEAAKKTAEILRLRNLSGIIIVDFINMKEEGAMEELTRFLISELFKDPVKTVFVDVTALGLIEITRKKISKPLHEIIQKTC